MVVTIWMLAVPALGPLAAEERTEVRPPAPDVERIQALVNELRERLSLQRDVQVSVVPENRQVVSVRPPKDRVGAFQLSIEEGFLQELTEDDLRAVVAHELGHVWIFSHHPYLQTERMANQIAMRVVSRDSLERVYAKLWARGGRKGEIARFLGD